jgi:hypothetical protein
MVITKELVDKYRNKNPELSITKLAKKIAKEEGIDYTDSTRRIVSAKLNKGKRPEKEERKWDEKDDSAIFEYQGTKKIDNFEDAIKYSGVDTEVWEAERKIFNSWEVTMKIDDAPVKRTNFQFKIWFRRKKYGFDDFRDDLLHSINSIGSRVVRPKFTPTKSGYALELDVFDPHFGKLSWGKETGEDYDINIAKQRYLSAVLDLCNKSSFYEIEEVVYPIGQDYFNYDSLNITTTNNTPQHTDVRWQKMFIEGKLVAIESIELIKEEKKCPVNIKVVPGKHDTTMTFMLGEVLDAYYKNDPNVTIDNSPKMKKYWRFGKCGIMFFHGDKGRWSEYPLVMMRDMQKEWADVEHLEIHCGHFHKTKKVEHVTADELQGIVVRVLKSIAGTDSWHYNNNYTNTIKGAEGFVWSKDFGLEANIKSNIL